MPDPLGVRMLGWGAGVAVGEAPGRTSSLSQWKRVFCPF